MTDAAEHDNPDHAYRRFERAVEWPMLLLSVVFLALLIVPEVTTVDRDTVAVTMGLIWAAFAAEVLALAYLAPSKGRMFREHWLDVLIVVVLLLRPVRVARLLQVVRAVSVGGRTVAGLSRLLHRKGLQLYAVFTLLLILGGALLVYGLERDVDGSNITTLGDALWWAVVTTTTVGYGDHFPVSADSRAVATVLMLVGIGLGGVVTANVAAYFVEREQADEMAEMRAQLNRIEGLLQTASPGMDDAYRIVPGKGG